MFNISGQYVNFVQVGPKKQLLTAIQTYFTV